MNDFQVIAATLYVVDVPFRFSFRHAKAERRQNKTLFLKMTGSNGAVGWGEGLTRPYLTGESPETVVEAVQEWWPALKALTFSSEDPYALLEPLWRQADALRYNAAWSLVDVACYDLWLKSSGIPAPSYRPEFRAPVVLPLGLGNTFKQHVTFRAARAMHFRSCKIKVATSASIEWYASRCPPDLDLVFDFNGCLKSQDLSELIAVVKRLPAGIKLEQPFAAGDNGSAAALLRECPGVVVVADESLCSMEDAHKLIETKAANSFNVRLAKLGGITGVRSISAFAQEQKVPIRLGGLVGETALLANAARFSMGWIHPESFEYSFPSLFLRSHPVASELPMFTSSVTPQLSNSGFGSMREQQLAAMTCQKILLP